MRINARLDKETIPQVEYLLKTKGLTISALLKKSVQYYYRQMRLKDAKAASVLMKTGFVGCGKGDARLSQDYKQAISEILGGKHDHR